MASFMVTLIVDHDDLHEEEVADLMDDKLHQLAAEYGFKVFDMTAYKIFTGRK